MLESITFDAKIVVTRKLKEGRKQALTVSVFNLWCENNKAGIIYSHPVFNANQPTLIIHMKDEEKDCVEE